ncbi:hypothetical protein VIGAN_04036300 [Vigna angularis var. angularis]|uniref:Secreted protein n=1 Tax=Vigna angularis var. angularis TaxID=157739 RepID=A0A0S3RRP4_PHAAN|nr:hypothetical protein VIGAN_04036300 [Vigna angularis var. angularis]
MKAVKLLLSLNIILLLYFQQLPWTSMPLLLHSSKCLLTLVAAPTLGREGGCSWKYGFLLIEMCGVLFQSNSEMSDSGHFIFQQNRDLH